MTWLGLLKSKSLEDELQAISKRYDDPVVPSTPAAKEFTIKLTPSAGEFYSWEITDPMGASIKRSNKSFETKFFALRNAKKFLKGYVRGKRTDKGEHVYKVRV